MAEITPYSNISSFMAFRSDEERAAYEDVHDFNKNWFDRTSYPEFRDYEQNILKFVQKLHDSYFEWGFLTIDSTEAIYCALIIHLLRFKEHSTALRPNLVVSEMGHIAFKKAAVLLGVELREVEVLDNGEVSLTDLASSIDEDTFAVVAIAGTTVLGNYDNIVEMDKVCASMNIPLHLDAAIGGFVYPFRRNSKVPSDFRKCKALASVNISGHKYGYSRPSVGILLVKNKKALPKELYSFSVPYLSGKDTEEFGLLGTKSPIGLIDLNFNVTTWGEGGYAKIVVEAFKQKERLIASLRGFNLEIIDSEDTPIFLISGEETILNDLSVALRSKGWYGSVNKLYKDRPSIRVVVRKHFDDKYVDGLIDVVRHAVKMEGGKI